MDAIPRSPVATAGRGFALDAFVAPERLDDPNNPTGATRATVRTATRRTSFWECPAALAIHLKRFDVDGARSPSASPSRRRPPAASRPTPPSPGAPRTNSTPSSCTRGARGLRTLLRLRQRRPATVTRRPAANPATRASGGRWTTRGRGGRARRRFSATGRGVRTCSSTSAPRASARRRTPKAFERRCPNEEYSRGDGETVADPRRKKTRRGAGFWLAGAASERARRTCSARARRRRLRARSVPRFGRFGRHDPGASGRRRRPRAEAGREDRDRGGKEGDGPGIPGRSRRTPGAGVRRGAGTRTPPGAGAFPCGSRSRSRRKRLRSGRGGRGRDAGTGREGRTGSKRRTRTA